MSDKHQGEKQRKEHQNVRLVTFLEEVAKKVAFEFRPEEMER